MQSIFEVKQWRRTERQRLLALREAVPDALRLERNATVTS